MMNTPNRRYKGAVTRKIIGGIFGIFSILGSASAANAKAFTLDELNFHIHKCYEATTAIPASTRHCDLLLKNRIRPRNVEANALYNRGVIYFKQGDVDRAESDFIAALNRNVELYQAHIALGEIAAQAQNYGKALKHYELVISQQGHSKALNKKREEIEAKLEFASPTDQM